MTSPWLDLTRAICDPTKTPADVVAAHDAVTSDLFRARLARAERESTELMAQMAREHDAAKRARLAHPSSRLHIIGGTDVDGGQS